MSSQYQSQNLLSHRGKQFVLLDQPLERYFTFVGKRPCEGEYVAHWEIEDGWLYLTHLACVTPHEQALSLQALFPFAGRRVFAAWHDGQIRGYKSERVAEEMHGRYPDLVLNLNCGHVESISLVHSASKPTASVSSLATAREQASAKVHFSKSNVLAFTPAANRSAEVLADATWNPGWQGALV